MNIIIGDTGFVGSNLIKSGYKFDRAYNSKNIESVSGGTYDTVLCAGVTAVKWLANKEPEADWFQIQRLMSCLGDIDAKRFILISTVDVYPNPSGVTENDIPTNNGHPYGSHRFRLEQWAREKFKQHHIVRLPALFGNGLKKNIIFDLLNNNNLDSIISESEFQWYPIGRLIDDISVITANDIDLINIVTQPIKTDKIIEKLFPHSKHLVNNKVRGIFYDVNTVYLDLLGGAGRYHMDEDSVLLAMKAFIETYEKS